MTPTPVECGNNWESVVDTISRGIDQSESNSAEEIRFLVGISFYEQLGKKEGLLGVGLLCDYKGDVAPDEIDTVTVHPVYRYQFPEELGGKVIHLAAFGKLFQNHLLINRGIDQTTAVWVNGKKPWVYDNEPIETFPKEFDPEYRNLVLYFDGKLGIVGTLKRFLATGHPNLDKGLLRYFYNGLVEACGASPAQIKEELENQKAEIFKNQALVNMLNSNNFPE